MLQEHRDIVSRQVDILRANMAAKLQNFELDQERFAARWRHLRPGAQMADLTGDAVGKTTGTLKQLRVELDSLLKTKEALLAEVVQLGLAEPDLSVLADIEAELREAEAVWFLYEEFQNQLSELAREEWILIRGKLHKFENFLGDWARKIKEGSEATTVTAALHREIDAHKDLMAVLKYCRGEVFSPQHWGEFFQITGIATAPVEKLLFADILEARTQILDRKHQLKDLNSRAQGEVTIREVLNELDVWGGSARFSLIEHCDSLGNDLTIVKEWTEVLGKVGELQCMVQSLKDSAYYQRFSDRAAIWEQRLSFLDQALHGLSQIQRKWLYLEPILGRGALPSESARFQNISDDFRFVMAGIARDDRILLLTNVTGLLATLSGLTDQLARCQRALNQYLELKRSGFPRFYFLGDEDLLEILGQATKPPVIQSHLRKLFAGIHSVQFGHGEHQVVAMVSLDGEVVPLASPVAITAEVEVWLNDLAVQMKETLQQLLTDCLNARKKGSAEGQDPSQYPSQILCLAEWVRFTEACEEAIERGTLPRLSEDVERQLEHYTGVELESNPVLELKLKALVLDSVHRISIIEELQEYRTSKVTDWHWQKQLRFYIQNGLAVVKMVDATFEYSYEYQGNAPKLVHTPLTDKCFISLTQGMRMGVGGNPYGPAGTGKTESVKALGNAMGRQVLVFNCDEGIDVRSMKRIFVGLVKCGAWGCFDEFNRLEESVLSALSVQIQKIQLALKERAPHVDLLDKQVEVDPNAGIFITMNPVGKGYGGRQKLPDNLKQLFRPVAMSRPDNDTIARVLLFSEGFRHSRPLGSKLVAIFDLARELLMPQQHYDWGLRALKSVLQACGRLLKSARDSAPLELDREYWESGLVVQAVRLNTLPKLAFGDCQQFDALVRDVFPDVQLREFRDADTVAAIGEAYKELGLVPNDMQVHKVLELKEQLSQRMGVVLVGPSGSGKTTLCRLLLHALRHAGEVVHTHTLNPKAMPRQQLLGHIDVDTREWHDGVLTASARQVIKEPLGVRSWIICDGDIDPEWIESLNSVLDDNHLLTMPSGERIQFGPDVNFLFETHDLGCASPATISRMGMIFLSPENVEVTAVVSSWLQEQTEEARRVLSGLLDDYFYRALQWVVQLNEFCVETTILGVVRSGLSYLADVRSRTQFALALVRGIAANLNKMAREKCAREIFSWMGVIAPDPNHAFDSCYNSKRDRLDRYNPQESVEVSLSALAGPSPPVVETVDVLRSADLILPWLSSGVEPLLVVGPEGCGKSVDYLVPVTLPLPVDCSLLLSHCLQQLHSVEVAAVHCCAQTTASQLLHKLRQCCVAVTTGRGRSLRPREADKLVLFLRDLNLVKPDKWGTCQLVAWLQQVVSYRGFYDQDLDWVGLERIQIVATMSSGSSLGKHRLSTRFTSLARILALQYPEKEQLVRVYSAYLRPVMVHLAGKPSDWSSPPKLDTLAASMVLLLEQMQSKFSVDDQSHYVFTPKTLTEWTRGLLRYSTAGSPSVLEPWVYEGCRLLRDRLADDEARARFDAILSGILRSDWGDSSALEQAKGCFYVSQGGAFSSHASELGRSLSRLERSDWEGIVRKAVSTYGHEVQEVGNTVLFLEVLELCARIDRVLSCPRGSLLLAGVAGMGRRMAASVVAHMHGVATFTPKMTLNYATRNLMADLKAIVQASGIENQQMLLLLEDHQLFDPESLEIVNGLLATGEVPGLFRQEELEPLLAPLRDQAAEEGYRGSALSYFCHRMVCSS
ncbi:cytoplasmic dynein 2 heavy chain 1 [Ixodes scapularis]|uniref:cytoplasmic dynein 2 heavy chain 1 n=1 Tax=Ixodes scapularis TaxID=6945 RepID=UPI001C384515|nr:cytoplasmic dynein 2 heavy chain 1 [Ixodes scapularis]